MILFGSQSLSLSLSSDPRPLLPVDVPKINIYDHRSKSIHSFQLFQVNLIQSSKKPCPACRTFMPCWIWICPCRRLLSGWTPLEGLLLTLSTVLAVRISDENYWKRRTQAMRPPKEAGESGSEKICAELCISSNWCNIFPSKLLLLIRVSAKG